MRFQLVNQPACCWAISVRFMVPAMNLTDIAQQQAGWLTSWNIINPFALATFFIYMVCATAGTNRAPFDLPEAESELVAGFMTEYSGFRWAMFFMGEYCAMFLLALWGRSSSAADWNGPVPVATLLGLTSEPGCVSGFIGKCLAVCHVPGDTASQAAVASPPLSATSSACAV